MRPGPVECRYHANFPGVRLVFVAFNSPDKAAQLGHSREGWSQVADLGAGPGISGAEWGIQSYRIVLPAL